eukprot:gene8662-1056_t
MDGSVWFCVCVMVKAFAYYGSAYRVHLDCIVTLSNPVHFVIMLNTWIKLCNYPEQSLWKLFEAFVANAKVRLTWTDYNSSLHIVNVDDHYPRSIERVASIIYKKISFALRTLKCQMSTFVLTADAWLIAGAFAWLSLIITCHQIYKHLLHWSKPEFQKWICRILFMVPIYALGSWLSLRFYTLSVYFDTIRNMYEVSCRCVSHILAERQLLFIYYQPFPYSISFLRVCKQATLQFCVIKPVTSIITIVLEAEGLYDEGDLSPRRGYLYIAIIYNMSIFISLTALMVFYAATKEHLRPHKPIMKFLIVKSVIFLAFWQGVGLAIAEATGLLDDNSVSRLLYVLTASDTYYTSSECTLYSDVKPGQVASAYQSFIICIEMFFVSLLHLKAFSWAPFVKQSSYAPDRIRIFHRVSSSLKSALNPRDIVDDTIRNFSVKYNQYHQTDFDDEDYAESISEEQYIETNVNGEVDRKKDLKDILKKRWSQRHPNENTTHPSILTSAVHKRKSDRKGELTENSLSSLDNDGRDNVDGKVSSVQYSSNDAQHVLREEEDIECSHSCEMEQKSLISREIAFEHEMTNLCSAKYYNMQTTRFLLRRVHDTTREFRNRKGQPIREISKQNDDEKVEGTWPGDSSKH